MKTNHYSSRPSEFAVWLQYVKKKASPLCGFLLFSFLLNLATCLVTSAQCSVPTASLSGNTAICSGSNASLAFSGTANATVTYNDGSTSNTVTLNGSGTASVSVSPTTTTTYTATGVVSAAPASCSGIASGSATVTVNTKPVFTVCPTSPVTANTSTSSCSAIVTYPVTITASGTLTPSYTYTTSGTTLTATPQSGTGDGTSFNNGTTSVSINASNSCGTATAPCTFNVVMTDNVAPSITCGANISTSTDPGQCGAAISVPTPVVTDNCSTLTLGNGLNFDGINDIAQVAATSAINTANQSKRTVEAYFRVNNKNISTRKQVIWEEGGSANGLNIYVYNGSLYYGVYSTGQGWSGTWLSTSNIQSGQWHNAVIVYDGTVSTGRLKAYLDGTLIGSANASSSLGGTINAHPGADAVGALQDDGVFHDGAVSATFGHYFGGDIDEIRVWTVARTAAELAATNTVQLAGNETGLILYYNFDQGTACGNNSSVNFLDDKTATNLNATLSNFALNGSQGCTSNWTSGSPALNSQITLTNSYTGTASASGTYPKGTTTVTWTAKDAANNVATCTQTVTVTDNQPPVLTCPANQTMNVVANTCANTYTIADPISDNCTAATWGATFSGNAIGNPATIAGIADGMGSGAITFNKGVTTVTLNGTDGTNAAATCFFTVTVNAPEIAVYGNANLIADGNTSVSTSNLTDFGANTFLRSFTIQNPGTSTLNVGAITFTGPDASDFSVKTAPTATIAPNGSTTFDIALQPSALGVRNAIMHIASNDCDNADYDFAIQATGIQGEALHFDGINDYADVTNLPAINAIPVTLEAFVKPDLRSDGTSFPNNVLSNDLPGNYGFGFGANVYTSGATNVPVITLEYKNGFRYITSPAGLAAGQWAHIAVVYNYNTITTYVNGVQVDNFSYSPQQPNANMLYMHIGKHNDDAGYGTRRFFKGAIDEVRVWNRALCATEIANQYTCQLSGTGNGLKANYNFNEGVASGSNSSVTTLYDATSNAANATLYNFALTGSSSNWIAPGGTSSVCSPYLVGDINVLGNGSTIYSGTTATSTTNNTNVGSAAVGSSVTKTFTLENTGTGSLTVTGITFTTPGTNPANYSYAGISLPLTLAANTSTTYTVTYTPSALANQTATINIASDDCDEGTYTFALSGTGTCAAPVAYNVTGGGAYCAGGTGVTIGIDNSENGVTYQLYRAGSIVTGSPVAGSTGNAVSFGLQTLAGTYTAIATRTAGSCTSNMTGSKIVSINALPTVNATPGGSTTFCQGGSVSLSATGANTYMWSNNATGNTITVGTGASYTVTGTDGNGCAATSAPVTVTVNANPVATATMTQPYPMSGQELQTIYLNYVPQSAQTQTMNVTATGGNSSYTYSWQKSACNGNNTTSMVALTTGPSTAPVPVTASSYTWAPTSSDICSSNNDNMYYFTVTVTDGNGCTSSASKRLNVVDPYVTGGNVQICHKVAVRGGSSTQLLQVAPSTVATHLAHGDYLGNCAVFTGTKIIAPEVSEEQNVTVYPNPTTGVFILELSSIKEGASIMITDVAGKLIANKSIAKDAEPTATFDLSNLAKGMYLIQVRDGDLNYRTKIVVQ